ncbi:VanZ family protein [Clostridioides sp. ES-S-0171-01]|nr:VanZ family protein [Clostridioides sp. ES-S-0054-01]
MGLSFSLAIEFCQLFNFRATYIDDLMMNTLGAVLGEFLLFNWSIIYLIK